VAVKISKNKKFDVENANVEIKILKKLKEGCSEDNEGYQSLVEFIDSFMFRQHVVIVFECLSYNLYRYQRLMKNAKKRAFSPQQLKVIAK
jgi:hypothetical protein